MVELDPKQNTTLFFDAGVEVLKTVATDEKVIKLLMYEVAIAIASYIMIRIISPHGNKVVKLGE